jgi:hypothetical protein
MHPVPKCLNSNQAFLEHRYNADQNTEMWTRSHDSSNSNTYSDTYYNYFPAQNQDSLFAQTVGPHQPCSPPELRMDHLPRQDCSNNSMPAIPFNYVGSECSSSIVPCIVYSSSGPDGSNNTSKHTAGYLNFAQSSNSTISSHSFSGASFTLPSDCYQHFKRSA